MPNGANSKKPSVGRPLSAKMPIARIVAGVPIKVIAPPSSDEKERGMSSFETGILVRRAMATTAGISIAVAPTLFMKAEATVTTSVRIPMCMKRFFVRAPSRVAASLREGDRVYMMIHCPNNLHCPAFARDFHERLRREPGMTALPPLPDWPLPRQRELL